jgi:hypothetical protein
MSENGPSEFNAEFLQQQFALDPETAKLLAEWLEKRSDLKAAQNIKHGAGRVKIIHEQPDPLGVLRASIGGTATIGYYLTYRGNTEEVVHMLKLVLAAFEMQVDVSKQFMTGDGSGQ